MPKRKRKGILVPSQAPTASSCSKKDLWEGEKNDQEELTSGSTWVQCENTKCLKWRRIAAEAAEQLGDKPWFCWLNPDGKYNRCTVEEEKPKKPKHMKFVYSLLPVGQVVMARMSGYPLWPAILTTDPSYGEYYDTLMNKENEVTHYHVEFLGEPHSHAWVVQSGVHPFASVSDEDKIPKFRKLHGKRLTDLKKSFQLALFEAVTLQKMEDSERLSGCHFHLKELTPNGEDNVASGANDIQPPQKDYVKQRSRGRSRASSTVSSTEDDLCVNEYDHTSVPRQRRSSSVESEVILHKATDPEENTFMDSLRTFLAGKGRSIHKEPRWRGKRINLYRFYNTVQRYGGCEQVCKGRLWTSVYNELVGDTSQAAGGIGTAARHFYERYLLPFEIHEKNQSSVDVQFVSENNDALLVRTACEVKTARTSAPLTSEQKVPKQSMSPFSDTENKPGSPREQELSNNSDCVPSSNPDSPSPYSDYSSDSEVEGDCEAAENELIQLERLLSSLEPSLYSPEEPSEIASEKQSKIPNPCQDRQHPSLVLPQTNYFTNNHGMREEIDVLKTLDEMAKMEGAILELDSLAAIELDAF